jgi:two-component system, chemotaxis family, sensor kinase CheA
MSTKADVEQTLLRLAGDLSARAITADCASVEDRAGLLSALSEITVQAKYAELTNVVHASRSLAAIVDQHGSDNSAAMAEGIAKLNAAIQGESPEPAPETAPPAAEPAASPDPAAPSPEPAAPAWAADPELLSEFFVEAADHLTTIETQLMKLEHEPGSREAIDSIFRGFHTIKGLAGFLSFPAMQQVAHETETLLDCIRTGKLAVTAQVIDVVLESADYLRRDMARLQEAAAGSPLREAANNTALIQKVRARMSGDAPAEASVPSASPEAREEAPEAARETRKSASVESRIIKVDTAKLDFLVDMVGELVISQSLIRHDGSLNAAANPKLQGNLSQLARITADVQKTAMSMRMVPVGQLFQKSVRMVRDLTRKSGKQAELEIEGEETELDRTIVEQLGDPLMHMIRNSADHGIEPPAERVAAGKPATAKIGLKAYHQSGHIVIEIRDDGRGLDRQKILKKAREKALVQDGATLSDKEVFNLIFEPGFSTAEKVTDVSGRGVGMDVVRKHVQKLRGGIDIQSTPGRGTTFFLKLPLTLAIIDGLVVGVAGERYIVPIYAVREIFRPTPETRFTVEGRDEMILVRDSLLPVKRLHRSFDTSGAVTELTEGVLVVAEAGGQRFCLFVDQVLGKQEVVIKSLGETFKRLPGVSGGAILGDGRVALILDLDTLTGAAVHV